MKNVEIERKFLVEGDFLAYVQKSEHIVQGYLSRDPQRAVRVRIKGDKGFLTIKGISNESGMSRYEFEKEITLNEADDLLKLCLCPNIEKVRHVATIGKHTWEIDVFDGAHKGLILAEIELSAESEEFIKPQWLGREVTGDSRYYNSSLSQDSATPPLK